MPLAVFVLGLCIFCLGTTEFMISGLLPLLSATFGVSIPKAGLLISAFAIGVAVGGPPLTLLLMRIDRRRALLMLMLVFTAGQAACALSVSYWMLMAARTLTGVTLGAFFGIGSVVASNVAGEARQGRAIAIMFGGLTIANILGVPLGAFVGQQWGWRVSFRIVTVCSGVALTGLFLLLPSQKPPQAGQSLGRELRPLKRPAVWAGLATTMFSQAAIFAVFSYLAPILTDLAGFAPSSVPPLLALFGVGTFIGTFIGGRIVDRFLYHNLVFGLILLAIVLGLTPSAVAHKVAMVACVLCFGVSAFVVNPALQTQVLIVASDVPTFTSTINISAFNLGNTIGPWLGGLLIGSGFGLGAPAYLAAALALMSVVSAVAANRLRQSATSRSVA